MQRAHTSALVPTANMRPYREAALPHCRILHLDPILVKNEGLVLAIERHLSL